jgi:hypothetical protein
MNPVGPGLPPLDPTAANTLANSLAAAPRPPSSHSGAIHDSVSASLEGLAAPAIQHLLQMVEERLFSAGSHQISFLPGARESAVSSVARAAHAVEMAGSMLGNHNSRIPGYPDPRAVLAVANQFIDTGQTANYLRAEELGRIVGSWYEGRLRVPAEIAADVATLRRERQLRFRGALQRMWWRAPLLFLLAGWLVAGLIAAFLVRLSTPDYESSPVFGLWALGFIALVVIQFIVSIWNGLRPKSRGLLPEAGKIHTGPKR